MVIMGLESKPKLHVIDFSHENLKPGSSAWASARNDVRRALEEHGCFEAKFDKLPRQLHDAVFATAQQLFDLPIEVKMRNTNTKPYFGYFGQYQFIPLYESLGIDHPTTLDATQNFTNLMWPAGNDRFRESAQGYSEVVTELDRTVTRMLFESYGVGNYYDDQIKRTNYLLRYLRYSEPKPGESNAGLLPHTDKTFLSIIHQGQISGLQVKLTKDDLWVDVPPSPTSFIVMAGEALMAWSNDRIPSCIHQVIMMRDKGRRYSLGMFSFIHGRIEILEGDEAHPIKYKSFDHFEFLHFFKSNWDNHPNIKTFCGL